MGRLIPIVCALVLLLGLPLAGQAPAPPREGFEGFRVEGSTFLAVASALGPSHAAATEMARGAALRSLLAGLGKDRLFSEVFMGAPPVGLEFRLLSAQAEGSGIRASVSLRIDDESVRLIERGPYLAAAVGLLDQAEGKAAEVEGQAARAQAAETEGRLGDALVAYGMTQDTSRSALSLIEGLGDGSIFSSKGARTAPELRRSLAAAGEAAVAGLERVKKAESSMATAESNQAVLAVIDAALAAADKARSLLDESGAIVGDVAAFGSERLVPLRDRLAFGRRSIADSTAALERAVKALAPGKSYLRDKADYARRRLATEDASLASAWKVVDQEIRDPAVRRARRAQAFRWVFLHVPREFLSLRVYPPFGFLPERGFEARALDARLGLEGAFSLGRDGIWARSTLTDRNLDLSSESESVVELALSQSFDLGFWGRNLFFIGYGWDWYRRVGEDVPDLKEGSVRIGLGGLSSSASQAQRADWLLCFSYDIPLRTEDFLAWNLLNIGVETQFRLGSVALLEATGSQRLHRNPSSPSPIHLDSVFAWSLGLGLRIPPPFTWGLEFTGSLARPLTESGALSGGTSTGGARFRAFIEYSF